MIKTFTLLAAIVFPSPDDPSIQAAFNQMTTDYAACSAYYDYKSAWYSIDNPIENAHALGGIASAGYEGHRTEALANLPRGTFEARRAALMVDMVSILEHRGFSALYSIYDGFCDDLRTDPGKAFLRRLKKPMKK